jgi:hypothetical protein
LTTTESNQSAAEEAIVAYAWALDSKDWPALRALLSDGLEMDFPGYGEWSSILM